MTPQYIGSLIHYCSKLKSLRPGLSLHAVTLKTGLQSDVVVSNHVLNMYAKCGNMTFARSVFDEMSERNIVSWSAIISGYDQIGNYSLALQVFSRMHLVPNEYVYSSAVSACSSLKAQAQGQQIHAHALKFGYDSVSFVSNSLISMYMKCGCCSEALSVYTELSEPSAVSYNALIAGFVENQQAEKGFEVFRRMYQQGLFPDRFTFVGLIGLCADTSDLQRGIAFHCQAIKLKLSSTPFVGNVMMTMYSKFNSIEQVEKVFRSIEEKDVVSWNTFLSACSHCLVHEMGLSVFKDLLDDNCGVKPDDFTFAGALASCAGLASVRNGKQIHTHLIKTITNPDIGVQNALVNMYAKCGLMEYAYTIFNNMCHRNLVSWNTIIAGFGNHGHGAKALELFEEMRAKQLNPDSVTFVGLLIACNHAGLVDTGLKLFNSMEETYKIIPDMEHFSCLIDLLGRAGRLQEAEYYINKYPFGQDPIVLGSLLSACRLHGEVVIGERLGEKLMKLQPVSTSPYVLLSNLYASDEMWDSVAEARKMLKGSGLKKEAGHSLIEVEGSFVKFTIGDFSHSRITEIKHVLAILGWGACEILSDSFTFSITEH